jgi:large subunit ribosomal protein L3
MPILLGKKVGMTQVYDDAGRLLPVTVIQAGPCVVTQVKSPQADGYAAVQLSFDDVKKSRCKKPQAGHAAKAGTACKRFVREMRIPAAGGADYNLGDTLTVSVFEKTPYVDVVGVSKGKGFSGTMKRHGFRGFPASHGTERKHRAPGSISSFASNAGRGAGPKRGKRMAGHAGNSRCTTKNHKLVAIDAQENLLVVKGPVPGAAGGYCIVRAAKKA